VGDGSRAANTWYAEGELGNAGQETSRPGPEGVTVTTFAILHSVQNSVPKIRCFNQHANILTSKFNRPNLETAYKSVGLVGSSISVSWALR
jgi:hypothetical protein